MAQILTKFTHELVVAICSHVSEISDRCFGRELISNEVYEQVLKSATTSTEQAARTLSVAIKDAVTINQTLFEDMMEILINVVTPVPPFMQEMEKQYQDLVKGVHSGSCKRKRTDSDPAEMDQELDAPLKVSKLIESKTISRVRIIEMFTSRIVSEISNYIATLCDKCYSKGLIGDKTYRRLHETTVNPGKKEKARILLVEVMKNIDQCFDLFLTILNKTLPTAIGSTLVSEIIEISEKYTLVNDNSHDIHANYQEAITRLDKANREKQELEEKLASKIRQNEVLREDLFREESREKESTERIEKLKEKIAVCEQEISYLRETIKFKEIEVENCYKKMRRERERFQEKSHLVHVGDLCGDSEELHRDAKKLEMEMLENLEIRNQGLEQKTKNLRQELEKTGFVEGNMQRTQEKNDLQEAKNELSQENCSLQSKLDFVKSEHGDCIIRFWSRPCYCYRGDIPREYCPAKIHKIV
jgi:hypothetical protein